MFNYSPIAWVATIIWIVLGLVTYKGYAAQREVAYLRKVTALEHLEKNEYQILLCLSKPELINSLTNIALAIAKMHKAEIICFHVIEVKESQPLLAGLDDTTRAMALLEEAEALITAANVPVRSILKVSHRISQGIMETATEENCNFIILARKKNPTFFNRFFSSTIDTIIQESPCEVGILHGNFSPEKIRNIFIPFGQDIHTRLASEIAPAFIEHFNCKLDIGVVFEPHIPFSEREAVLTAIKGLISETALPAKLVIVKDRDVLEGVLRYSKKADLILMGGRTGDFLELLLGKSLAQEITELSTCPVLWIKEYEERASFWTSLFKPYRKAGKENG